MIQKTGLCIAMIAMANLAMAGGVVIYKSTGPDGKVSYTDHPPASAQGQKLEVLLLPEGPGEDELMAARERTQAELEASRDVTDRMAADRREREELRRQAAREREERAYREAWAQAQAARQQVPDTVWAWPVSGYYSRPHHGRPGYPGYPGKPDRPDKPKPRPEPRTPPAQSGSGGMSASDLINRSRPW